MLLHSWSTRTAMAYRNPIDIRLNQTVYIPLVIAIILRVPTVNNRFSQVDRSCLSKPPRARQR